MNMFKAFCLGALVTLLVVGMIIGMIVGAAFIAKCIADSYGDRIAAITCAVLVFGTLGGFIGMIEYSRSKENP